MQLDISKDSIPVYEALASETRIQILNLLSQSSMNIKELAHALHMSSAIITRHINQLEKAQLIRTEKKPGKSGIQKVSKLVVDKIEINFPTTIYPNFKMRSVALPVGHYTDYDVAPTCGLASSKAFIGHVDEPKYFMDSSRMDAQIIWFTQGYLEYKVPNPLQANERIELLEISFEIASEFPYSNNVWPSDISFYINGRKLGTWTCPGNFSDIRGKYTPSWWQDANSQYGLFKTIRISKHGTHFDGDILSELTLDDLELTSDLVSFRIAVEKDAKNIGGTTIFGKGFGNHQKDIEFGFYYSEKS